MEIPCRYYICLVFLASFVACKQNTKLPIHIPATTQQFALYAKTVKDSFYISVQLPLDYDKDAKKHYPVVVLNDANFYFPVLAPVLHQYEKGGLLPPMILVGVGYRSFDIMDSLRVRDYLYPAAIPSDEMKAPGGGINYYRFIISQLLPRVDSAYRTESNNRTLLGHSFGGYFSVLALLNQVNQNRHDLRALCRPVHHYGIITITFFNCRKS